MHDPSHHRRRVLVVDGDDAARDGFVSALETAGYDVIQAWSVVQAMRLVLSARPGAVVLDLVLPDGHGIDVGMAMRAIVTTRRICVVAVTSTASSIALVDPDSFGARTILVKPVSPRELVACVAECFADAPDASPSSPRT